MPPFTPLHVLRLLAAWLLRLLCGLLIRSFYRLRILGAEHIPRQGPALLVCNHVSYIDGLLVAACVPRFVRFLIYRPIYEAPALRWFFRLLHGIPIAGGPYAPAALARARAELLAGHVVCIFAEGAISRTGNLLPFKRGFEQIITGLQVPVIPMHMDQLWGSIWSFQGGRALGKWPQRVPYPVTVSFAAPLPATATAPQVRQAVMELGSTAMLQRPGTMATLPQRFIRTAKRRWSAFYLADATGQSWTGGQALVHCLLLAQRLRQGWPQAERVGVGLPPSAMAALLHVAIMLAGKVPIALDTAGTPAQRSTMLQQYALDLVVIPVQAALALTLPPGTATVTVTALAEATRRQGRARHLCVRYLPTALLQRLWHVPSTSADTLATVVSTSEDPEHCRGVMLSHRNILATIEGLQQVLTLQPPDRLLGVLPFSHALGALATLWFPLVAGCGVVYHTDDAAACSVGDVVAQQRVTMLVATPTHYATYLDTCSPEAFASLRYAVSGPDQLDPALAQAFHATYGVELVAGYGCAEMAAIVALNIANVPYGTRYQLGSKSGTVGQPLPGVAVRVVDPVTGQLVPPETVGELWLHGAHRMLGYWGESAQAAQGPHQGWYVTGEWASVDDDGFLRLVERMPPPLPIP